MHQAMIYRPSREKKIPGSPFFARPLEAAPSGLAFWMKVGALFASDFFRFVYVPETIIFGR